MRIDKGFYKNAREEKRQINDTEMLISAVKKRIETTMIGALSVIEDRFGFLWDDNSEVTEEQKSTLRKIYNEARSEILDKGNGQSRNIDVDFSEYTVQRKRYHYDIPIKRKL